MGSEKAGHVLQEDEWWAAQTHFLQNADKSPKRRRVFASKPFASTGERKVVAREGSSGKNRRRNAGVSERVNISDDEFR